MIYVLSVTINLNHEPICSITAHALNSFGVNLNYIGALFRINEFFSAWKMCSLKFWRKMLALYFNC